MWTPVLIILLGFLAVIFSTGRLVLGLQHDVTVPPAHFHHLHLNSVNPSAAAEYYANAFSSVMKASLAGFEGFRTTSRLSSRMGNVYVLFTRVDAPPPTQPQSAIWHFGWNTPDSRQYLEKFHVLKLQVMPTYADPDGTVIEISSDSLPGYLTKRQIAEARANGTMPTRTGGFPVPRGSGRRTRRELWQLPRRAVHAHTPVPRGSRVRSAVVREASGCDRRRNAFARGPWHGGRRRLQETVRRADLPGLRRGGGSSRAVWLRVVRRCRFADPTTPRPVRQHTWADRGPSRPQRGGSTVNRCAVEEGRCHDHRRDSPMG